jgi:hypothetical protein
MFLDGPHLLLLIYINTTGMMNLKRSVQFSHNPRTLTVINNNSIHNNNKVTIIQDYVVLEEFFALPFERLKARFSKNSSHVI